MAPKEEQCVIEHAASANGKSQLGTVDLSTTKEHRNYNYMYVSLYRNFFYKVLLFSVFILVYTAWLFYLLVYSTFCFIIFCC